MGSSNCVSYSGNIKSIAGTGVDISLFEFIFGVTAKLLPDRRLDNISREFII